MFEEISFPEREYEAIQKYQANNSPAQKSIAT